MNEDVLEIGEANTGTYVEAGECERHKYKPSAREGICLYEMPDRTMCQSKDADAVVHQPLPSDVG